ncbi:hypothetical protein [Chryseobacterium sp. MA9]|uniref:hypothetical protein n=1 Tax=Chryseobacterium sp. MA9 TaxID=2966625 RepID=UPI002105A769|nr:hypothetical protein [Chryseobacterium sp. MA9]UTX48884.1 hypothetical protein KIK00_01030 [Chryseobacterium sp. MA9]
MKTKIILLLTILTINRIYAQIGINTPVPKATLDIIAKIGTGTSSNPEGILIPRVDRERAQSMIGVEVSTMLYIDNVSTGTQTGTAINIDAPGYYYFNGSSWAKLSISAGSTNVFIPTVVAAGRASNSFNIADSSGFNKWVFTVAANDGGWNVTNNTYTTSKTGFYQISLHGFVVPNTPSTNNSFVWNLKYGNDDYNFSSIAGVNPTFTYNRGGVIVLYLDQNTILSLGGIPCNGCSAGSTYTVSTRSFTISYLGN